ncbi:MAG: hypothetical protein MHMPM18_003525 [Marteilia pararefringens]
MKIRILKKLLTTSANSTKKSSVKNCFSGNVSICELAIFEEDESRKLGGGGDCRTLRRRC